MTKYKRKEKEREKERKEEREREKDIRETEVKAGEKYDTGVNGNSKKKKRSKVSGVAENTGKRRKEKKLEALAVQESAGINQG